MDSTAELLIALVAAFGALSGLVVWIVKHIVRKSDTHLEKLIGLLETSVQAFAKFEEEEVTIHGQIMGSQRDMAHTQAQIITELERLTAAVDRLTNRLKTNN